MNTFRNCAWGDSLRNLRRVLVLVGLMMAPRLVAAVPPPLALWTFDRDARDQIGSLHGELVNGAVIREGRLVLRTQGAALLTDTLATNLTEKTVVLTVRPADAYYERGRLFTVSENSAVFDGVSFGWDIMGAWGEGQFWSADNEEGGAFWENSPEPDPDTLLHVVAVYDSGGGVTLYRNGKPFIARMQIRSRAHTFPAGQTRVIIGEMESTFRGEIEEAALYDRALTAAEVAELGTSLSPSVARMWNLELLKAIRIDTPHPPVHARNLFTLSAAMYDAWAAYDPVAVGLSYRRKHTARDVEAARDEAISYAAYTVLSERFANSLRGAETLLSLRRRMQHLGFDPDRTSVDLNSPTGVGLAVATSISRWFLNDGSRQTEGYQDVPASAGGYVPTQPHLDSVATGVGGLQDVNHWQPLIFTEVVPAGQNGSIVIKRDQSFLGAHWLGVRPFCLVRDDPRRPWMDPGPPPQFGGPTETEFRSNVVAVIRASSELTPGDGVIVDISPAAQGNNPLGLNTGKGHTRNPVTGKPYAPNLVRRGDFTRVLAEFWADGPHSETPPGHWNVLANQVTDSPGFSRQIGGVGPVLGKLEWDVKLYFSLNAAVHDAACAAWSLKRYYDGWRPLAAVRYLASLGQSSDPHLPRYHPSGLPLIPGLIELTTSFSVRVEGPHAGLAPNQIAIRAWSSPEVSDFGGIHFKGVSWIDAQTWVPYQRKSFVTPAFPGYISGHSTFSRAAAEVLTEFTGSAFFPGGMATHTVPVGGLGFEPGPAADVQLQWATYRDAADQAGLSRIWGGIHPPADDFPGRRVGAQCGQQAWALARQYFDGSVANQQIVATLEPVDTDRANLRYGTIRGLYYQVESASELNGPYSPIAEVPFRAEDGVGRELLTISSTQRWFRVTAWLSPLGSDQGR
ncbi:MAG: hypothetical protein J0M24_14570 [Verrucomicrobia bacterium]|nr:hypothetical protein [Verrucomicrobiota bacterium]